MNTAELDFQKIKDAQKAWLRALPDPTNANLKKYRDWDFDGAGLNFMMDALAYNTHYNAMLAHMSMNEAFLDSAQLRGNVVSSAKLVGYTPRSAQAAAASFTLSGIASAPSTQLTIPRGFATTTTVNGTQYNFVVTAPVIAVSGLDQTITFENVVVKQGTMKSMLFRVDSTIPYQRFEIPENNVDTTTLLVSVKASPLATDVTSYVPFLSFSEVDSTTALYHLQENSNGRYEVYFGDGILGKLPAGNSIVTLEYIYTDGSAANGATSFTLSSGLADVTWSSGAILAVSPAAGGAPRESIDSVRYNAPISFVTQNRAVTAEDYRALILKEEAYVKSVAVWGGEINDPPTYGSVFISIAPTGGGVLTTLQRATLLAKLKGKNVVSISPVLVDPDYTGIALDVFFKYNPGKTNQARQTLENYARDALLAYDDNNLGRFDGVFRYSQVLAAIDGANAAIANSFARVYMTKTFQTVTTSNNHVVVYFSGALNQSSGAEPIITSTPFQYNGLTCYFTDSPSQVPSRRTLQIYTMSGGVKHITSNAGTVYTDQGKIVIDTFRPDIATAITLTVQPNSNDVAPRRNQLVQLDRSAISIVGSIDTIALAGSAGLNDYIVPSIHR